MCRILVSCFQIIFILTIGQSQVEYIEYHTQINGQPVTILIKDKDTMIIAQLEKAIILAPKIFEKTDDRDRYNKYRRYSAIVYPYAVQAVRLYKQLEKETEGKSDRQKRKVVKQISKRLKDEFETPLKNLSKTQGFLLTKMIEKNLDMSFFHVIKELKGGFSATYYNELAKIYGYHLKNKYASGEDEILDSVLEEFDLQKDVNNTINQ